MITSSRPCLWAVSESRTRLRKWLSSWLPTTPALWLAWNSSWTAVPFRSNDVTHGRQRDRRRGDEGWKASCALRVHRLKLCRLRRAKTADWAGGNPG